MEDIVKIFGKNFEISDRINNYVMGKIGKVDRFLPDIDDIRIDLGSMKKDRYTAQITIKGKGYMLRTEESSDDLSAAFDLALDKMFRQIERYKGKRSRNRGTGETLADAIPAELDHNIEQDAEPEAKIVRRKKFEVLPMDELEAIEQMELSSHNNFYIFYNANTSSVNVLYKRNDGTYGVIEPQIG